MNKCTHSYVLILALISILFVINVSPLASAAELNYLVTNKNHFLDNWQKSFVEANRAQAKRVAINLDFSDVEAGANMLLAQMGHETDWGHGAKQIDWAKMQNNLANNKKFSLAMESARSGDMTSYASKLFGYEGGSYGKVITNTYKEINDAYNIQSAANDGKYAVSTIGEKITYYLGVIAFLFIIGYSSSKRRSRVNANTQSRVHSPVNDSSNNHRGSSVNTDTQAEFKINNWCCYKCGKVVEASSVPNTAGCSGSNRSHGWQNIGTLGDNKYKCTQCGVVVKARSIPNGGCPKGNSHIFQQLIA